MIVTISQYSTLALDANGVRMPIGKEEVGATLSETAAGDFDALEDDTRFIRVATDTAVHFSLAASADTSDLLIPANTIEFFAVKGGETCSIAAIA